MEIIVNRDMLFNCINNVKTAVKRTNIIHMLDNLLIETCDDNIKITAMNDEVTISAICKAEIVCKGIIAVNAKILFNVVKELTNDTVIIIDRKRSNKILLKCGNAQFLLSSFVVDLFPKTHEMNCKYKICIENNIISKMIAQTHIAISSDALRTTINGLYIRVEQSTDNEKTNVVSVVGTDTHRLATCYANIITDSINRTPIYSILPKSAVYELRRMVSIGTDFLEIIFDDNYIKFSTNDIELTTRLIAGRFPDYNAIIPNDNNNIITVNKNILINAIKRMLSITDSGLSSLEFSVYDDVLSLKIENNNIDTVLETINVESKGEDNISVKLNSKYLKQFLDVIDGDVIKIFIKDYNSPLLLTDPSDINVQFILMPMRV